MWLKESIRAFGIDLTTMPKPTKRGTDHLPSGAQPWKTLWSAGQGIGLIHDISSVADLVHQLQKEYLSACTTPDMADAAVSAMRAEADER
jgi:nitronate monooxygenase